MIVVQVQDLRERRRAEAERARARARAGRADGGRAHVAQRLRAVQRISDAALGTLAFDDLVRRAAQAHRRGAGGRHRRGRAPRGATATVVVYQARRGGAPPVRAALATTSTPDDERHPGGLAARRRGRVDARGAAGRRRRRRSAPCTSARCSPARSPRIIAALLRLAADRAAIGIQRARLTSASTGSPRSCSAACCPAQLPAAPGLRDRRALLRRRRRLAGGRRLVRRADPARRPAAADRRRRRRARDRRRVDDGPAAQRAARLRARRALAGLAARAPERVPGRPARPRHDDGLAGRVDPATRRAALRQGRAPAGADRRRRRAARPGSTTRAARPLGALDDPCSPRARRTLEPGATLVLYSDGLVELRGEPLDRGLERLAAATDRRARRDRPLCDAILAGTLANPAAEDDVTLLVVRMRGRAAAAGRRAVPAPAAPTCSPASCAAARGRTTRVRSAAVELPGGLQASAAARGVVADTLSGVASTPRARRPADRRHRARQQRRRPRRRDRRGRARAGARRRRRRAAAGRGLQPRRRVRAARAIRRRRARRVRSAARGPALQPLGGRRRRGLLRVVRDRSFAHRRISNT